MEIGKVYVFEASDGINLWFAPLEILKNGNLKGLKVDGYTSTRTSKPVNYSVSGGSRFILTDDVPPKLRAAIEGSNI